MTDNSSISDYKSYIESKSLEERVEMLHNIDPQKYPDRVEMLQASLKKDKVDPNSIVTQTTYERFSAEKRNMILVFLPFMLMFGSGCLILLNIINAMQLTKQIFASEEKYSISTGIPQNGIFAWYDQNDKSRITGFEFVLNGKNHKISDECKQFSEMLRVISNSNYDSISILHYIDSDNEELIDGMSVYRGSNKVDVLSVRDTINSHSINAFVKIFAGIILFAIGWRLRKFLFGSGANNI